MNKHFTITINDDDGVYQVNLHKFVKKIVLYFLLFLLFVALFGLGTIVYLDSKVEWIEHKRIEMQQAYMQLKIKNSDLDSNIKESQTLLDVKKRELDEISDSLSEIEEMIGLSNTDKIPLKERISETKITSEQIMTLFQFIPNGSPIEYNGITSKFGFRIHPTLGTKEFHRGDDMKADMNTPVYATADGIVELAGMHEKSGYGNLIVIQHNFGFKTYFGHLNKIVIKSGEFIKKGELIAYSGTTGMSNGPHLHYEIRFLGRFINPFSFIKWNLKNYNDIFEKEQTIPWQSLLTATANIKIQKPTQIPPSSQQVLLSKGK